MKAHVSIKSVDIISSSPRQNHHHSTTPITKKHSFKTDDSMEADTRTRVWAVVSGGTHQRSTSISSIDNAFLDLGHGNNSFETIETLSVEGTDW